MAGYGGIEPGPQIRAHGKIAFEVGAFTNIGEDHISPIEHPTLEDYFASKLKIFSQSRFAVVNLDMDHVDRVLEAASRCERTVTFLPDRRACRRACAGDS